MPQIVKCSNCGYILYRGNELVQPREIAKRFSGKCPKCSSILSQNPISIEVQEQKK